MHNFSRHHTLFWSLVFIVVGFLLLLNNFGLLMFDIWDYWPVLLILFGAKLLVQMGMGHSDDERK